MHVKIIFVGTEEVHYIKFNLISKIDFVPTKEKGHNPTLLLPECTFTMAQSVLVILLVKNSESNKLDLDQLC